MYAVKTVISAFAVVVSTSLFGQPIVGVDLTGSADLVRAACERDASCSMQSLLPITNRSGSAAQCVTSTLTNSKLHFRSMGLYLLYDFQSSCPYSVSVHTKIGNKWYEYVGNISAKTNATVSVLYAGSSRGDEPAVVMFCRNSGSPRDDLSCSSDKAPAALERSGVPAQVNTPAALNAARPSQAGTVSDSRERKSEVPAINGGNRAGMAVQDRPALDKYRAAMLAFDVTNDDAIEKIRQLQSEFGEKYELSLDAAFHLHLKEQFSDAITAYKLILSRFGPSSYIGRLIARANEKKSPAIRTGVFYRSGGNIVSSASVHYKFVGSRMLVEVGSVLLETMNADTQYEVCGLRVALEKLEESKRIYLIRSETADVTGLISQGRSLVTNPVDLVVPLPYEFDLANTSLNLDVRLLRNGQCDVSFTLRHRPGQSGF